MRAGFFVFADGGFLFEPAAGIDYTLRGRGRLFLTAGYGFQRLERLKRYAGDFFVAELPKRSGAMPTLTVGVRF